MTPVTLYLKVRDQFTDPVLLESNDFGDVENCFSFIGLDSIAGIEVQNKQIKTWIQNQEVEETDRA